MLTIRFSRVGKKKKPQYRIVISEKSQDTQGHYLELLGHYNPHTKDATLKEERIKFWLERGATASNSVFNLLVTKKIIQSDKKRRSVTISAKRAEKMKKSQEKPEAEKAQPQEKQQAAEAKQEKPAEEKKKKPEVETHKEAEKDSSKDTSDEKKPDAS